MFFFVPVVFPGLLSPTPWPAPRLLLLLPCYVLIPVVIVIIVVVIGGGVWRAMGTDGIATGVVSPSPPLSLAAVTVNVAAATAQAPHVHVAGGGCNRQAPASGLGDELLGSDLPQEPRKVLVEDAVR